jgi:DNA-binding response OmpR family regulator
MHTTIEPQDMTDPALPLIQILLAESDPVEVDRIVATIDPAFQAEVRIAKNYEQLLERIAIEKPQLVFLGKIGNSDYQAICKECRKTNPQLPIVLISQLKAVSDSFLKLVVTCGLTDVISHDPVKLNQIVQQISKHPGPIRTQPADRIAASLATQAAVGAGDLQNSPTRLDNFTDKLSPNEHLPSASNHQETSISCRVMLAALEEIVSVSNNYFGPLAQGNYWRKSHAQIVDELPFITEWSADHFSKITCQEHILERGLTVEDIHSLQVWVNLFIKECERIIVDFRAILNNADLSLLAKNLLIIL